MSHAVRRRAYSEQDSEQRRHKPDYYLVLLSILLLAVGLIVVYAISPGLSAQKQVGENYFVNKQLISIGLGIIAFLITANIPLAAWKKFQKPLIVFALIAAFAVRILGEQVNGAYRWVQIGGISFQAVELVKLAVLICLALFLAERIQKGEVADNSKTLWPIVGALVGIGLVVAGMQSDLGSTGVIVGMMVAMGFMAGLPLKRVALIATIIVAGAVLAISTTSYRRDRFLTFLNPEKDCLNTGYQACQALIAVGSGGLFGKGLARSVQAYGYLPEAANDSIFAIFAEKFGFVGVCALLVLFMVLFARLKNIMERSPDTFSRLLIAGILAWLSTQAFINIGAMIGLLPLKGITLPFVSYGGTSIIFVTAIIGIAYNISRYTTFGAVNTTVNQGRGRYDNPRLRRGNRRPYYANPSNRA